MSTSASSKEVTRTQSQSQPGDGEAVNFKEIVAYIEERKNDIQLSLEDNDEDDGGVGTGTGTSESISIGGAVGKPISPNWTGPFGSSGLTNHDLLNTSLSMGLGGPIDGLNTSINAETPA